MIARQFIRGRAGCLAGRALIGVSGATDIPHSCLDAGLVSANPKFRNLLIV
ncbi:MAG: hypothetical protein WAW36_14585 [Methylovulum miyakonense]|uniref:hypothetical protein n=1 Tax=Methylovulum miyakonense TaxID=645578 RepID=UPI003BB7EF6C